MFMELCARSQKDSPVKNIPLPEHILDAGFVATGAIDYERCPGN